MSENKSSEDLDTLKFRVPKQPAADIEHTRVYRTSDIMSKQNSSQASGKTSQSSAQKTSDRSSAGEKSRTNAEKPQKNQEPPEEKNRKASPSRKKKKSGFGKFIRNVFIIAVILFLGYSSVALYYITKITPIETTGQYVNDPETLLYSSDIKNILVIGEDSRDTGTRGLSDSMILISLNKKNHKLQMTSFMRDMYTEIDGHDYDKINAAYSYGGAELLKDTIEDNFKIRIDGCITVNFSAVAHIVDAVGGVQITLSPEEANAVNEILYNEVNEILGDAPEDDFLPMEGGTFKLNGKQALSYSRIRYIGDADFERTQRQRTVITQLMGRLKKINPVTFNKGMKKALSYIGTDMSVTDMYLLSLRLPSLLVSYKPEQMRIPADNTWSYDETWDGMSIIQVDFYANTEYLKNHIYLAQELPSEPSDDEPEEQEEEYEEYEEYE